MEGSAPTTPASHGPAELFDVVVSSSGDARFGAALDFLASLPPAAEALVIAATREAASDLLHALAERRGASFGIHLHTLNGLAARLAAPELGRRGLSPLTLLGAEALAAHVVQGARETASLHYLEPVAGTPSFARALAQTAQELRTQSIDLMALRGLGAEIDDLAILLTRFAAELEEERVVDRAGLFSIAAKAAHHAPPMPFVLLDVPLRAEVEAALVRAMARRSSRVMGTVPTGDVRTERALAAMGATTRRIDAVGEGALGRLQRYLFTSGEPPRGSGDDDVTLFSAPGEGRECVEIARRIQAEARRGVPFDAIAVAMRAPNTYRALLEAALARAGIPAWFSSGTRRPHASGRALLALLACKAESLSAERFAEYLSLVEMPPLVRGAPHVTEEPRWRPPRDESLGPAGDMSRERADDGALDEEAEKPEGDDETEEVEEETRQTRESVSSDQTSPVRYASRPAPWKWEELVVRAKVIKGGKQRWEARLSGLGAEMRLRLARARNDGSPRATSIERDLQHLEDLRRFALPVIDALLALPEEGRWGDWLRAIAELAPLVLRRPEGVLEALAELEPMARMGPVRLSEVREVLTERLSSMTTPPPRRRHGCVLVATPAELRGRVFDVVFVPGLAERIFPEKPREDPLCLDARREVVGRRADEGRLVHPALPTQADRSEDERLLLRIAVGAARQRVHASYPRVAVGEDSRSRVPSFYALDLVRAIAGEVPAFTTLERDAASVSGARLAWPAPPDPTTAIDDTEHDLAILGPLLRSGANDATGRAAYLLKLNEHLARSLRTRWKRWRRPWSRFDGLVGGAPSVSERLAGRRLDARPYSVSALQKYAACPYRFYLSAIVGLSPREDTAPLERLDPATRGRLIHGVVAGFLRDLEARGRHVTPESSSEDAEAIHAKLTKDAEALKEALDPPIDRVWADEIESVYADLKGILRKMAAHSEAWRAHRAEWSFGLIESDDADSRSSAEPALLFDRYLLRGQIDLVERDPTTDQLRITDLKTGADDIKPFFVIGGGELLQPVLYSLAFESLARREVAVGRLFYASTKAGFSEHTVHIHEEARRRGREVLEIIDRAIEKAFFAPLPRVGACAQCSYRAVCGPDAEKRAVLKDHQRSGDPAAIEDLFELRRRS